MKNIPVRCRATLSAGKRLALTLFGLAMFVGMTNQHALAADEGDVDAMAGGRPLTGKVEQIVVTARKRAESEQDVPVAITALSSATLESYAITDLGDVSRFVPQLIIAKGQTGAGAVLYLRGVGSSPLSSGFDQAVSVNIDGIQVSKGRAVQQSYFDLAQIEVLRGPQALFFGKNSPAGIVALTSANPADAFELKGKVGYELEADEKVAELVVSGPLSDVLGARLAVRYSDIQGYFRNIAVDRMGADPSGFDIPGPAAPRTPRGDEFLGRLTLQYDPGTNFDALAKVNYSRLNDSGPGGTYQNALCPSGTPVPINGVPDVSGDCAIDKFVARNDVPAEFAMPMPGGRSGAPYTDYDSVLASLTMNYHWDQLVLTSVTGYYRFKNEYLGSFDNTASQVIVSELNKYRAFSEELRIVSEFDGPVNFMLGGFFQDTAMTFESRVKILPLPQDSVTGKYHTWEKPSQTGGKTWSIFGQIQWDITDELELAGGTRWTRETKNSFMELRYVHPLLLAAFPPRRLADDFSDSDFSSEVTLTWMPSDELTVYAAYKEGYKSGGFNNSAILNAATRIDDLTFDSESARGGEVGLKANLFDSSLRFNVTAYYYEYDDLQVTVFDSQTVTFSVGNAAKLETKGIEADFTFVPSNVPELTLHGAIAYNDATYKDFIGQCWVGQSVAQGCDVNLVNGAYVSQDYAGMHPPRAPKWSAQLGFSYSVPVFAGMLLTLTGDANYTSAYKYFDTLRPDGTQGGVVLLDTSIRLGPVDGPWEIAFIGRNLTDRLVVTSGAPVSFTGSGTGTNSPVPADANVSVNRPRELWLEISFRY